MRWYILTTILFATVGLLCVAQAEPQALEPTPTKDHPLLEVDLRKFGYERFGGSRRTPTFVEFTDLNHLALAWVTADNSQGVKKVGTLTPQPAHLHVLVLDARTGRKDGQKEWSTPYDPVRFFGVRDGKFLTCTGSLLRLFSPSFEVIREQELPNRNACLNPAFPVRRGVSPSRRTLLLSIPPGPNHQTELLDTETFAVLYSWMEERIISGISDHWLVGNWGKPLELCLRKVGEPCHSFRPSGLDQQLSDWRNKIASFVSDETLVIEGENKMAVTTVQGAVLFQVTLPKKESFDWPVASAGGERFAVIENRLRGLRNESLDMYPFESDDRAVVYSIRDRGAIYAVRVKGTSPWTPWDTHDNQLALSPDGTLLALLSDGVLKIYQLPSSNIEQR